MAQWIRPRTLNREVPGLNLLTAAVVPFDGQGTLSSLPSLSERTLIKPLVHWLLAYKQLAFSVAR